MVAQGVTSGLSRPLPSTMGLPVWRCSGAQSDDLFQLPLAVRRASQCNGRCCDTNRRWPQASAITWILFAAHFVCRLDGFALRYGSLLRFSMTAASFEIVANGHELGVGSLRPTTHPPYFCSVTMNLHTFGVQRSSCEGFRARRGDLPECWWPGWAAETLWSPGEAVATACDVTRCLIVFTSTCGSIFGLTRNQPRRPRMLTVDVPLKVHRFFECDVIFHFLWEPRSQGEPNHPLDICS